MGSLFPGHRAARSSARCSGSSRTGNPRWRWCNEAGKSSIHTHTYDRALRGISRNWRKFCNQMPVKPYDNGKKYNFHKLKLGEASG